MRRLLVTCVLLSAALSGRLAAQPIATTGPAAAPVPPYEGVMPGTSNLPPRAQSARRSRARLLTWPGFQSIAGGGTRVFLQVSANVETQAQPAGRVFTLLLRRVKVHLRNNRNPLETRYFNTPVDRVRIEPRGRDLAVVLDLRTEVTPTVRTEPGPNGFTFVFLDFPPGQYPIPAPAAAQPPSGEAAASSVSAPTTLQ